LKWETFDPAFGRDQPRMFVQPLSRCYPARAAHAAKCGREKWPGQSWGPAAGASSQADPVAGSSGCIR